MNTQVETTRLILNRIFHPSDFSQASEVALAHALKLALIARAELRMMHVAVDVDDRHWSDFPGVRATLTRWGLLPEGSTREVIGQLGLNIGKILYPRAGPRGRDAALSRCAPCRSGCARDASTWAGMAQWLHRAVAEPVARRAGTMTLFLPQDVAGFIALNNGAVTLRHMLIPIDQVPRPQAAVEVAAGLARILGCPEVSFTLVHVSATGEIRRSRNRPREVDMGQDGAARGMWSSRFSTSARACAADLIVLTTQGHQGWLDTLRGSTFRAYPAQRPVSCPGHSGYLAIQEITQKGKMCCMNAATTFDPSTPLATATVQDIHLGAHAPQSSTMPSTACPLACSSCVTWLPTTTTRIPSTSWRSMRRAGAPTHCPGRRSWGVSPPSLVSDATKKPNGSARPKPQHDQDDAIQDSACKGSAPIQDACERQRAKDRAD